MSDHPDSRMRSPTRYVSQQEDSQRWVGFRHRQGDIVISTRSKSGTTWMQTICALLIFQTEELPEPMATLSPWLDWKVAKREEVFSRLDAQQHRRIIKTHTPLDGIPLHSQVTYIVVARHPLDMAVSYYCQRDNFDRNRMEALVGEPQQYDPSAARPPLREWLVSWIDRDIDPRLDLESLPGAMWHLADAWRRRAESNVLLVHYDDLLGNLDEQMRYLAGKLQIVVDERAWPELVRAATFECMRDRADMLVPNPSGIMKDSTAFFRRGTSGAGRLLLDEHGLARYRARVATLAPHDLLTWLHRDAA
jgi:aryl sulfotransferase